MLDLWLLGALAAAVQVAPELRRPPIHVEVVRVDGTPAAGAVLILTCGSWQHTATADALGRATVVDVPPVPCQVRALTPGARDQGIDQALAATASSVRAVLPAPLTTTSGPPPSVPWRLDLRHDTPGDASGRTRGWRLESTGDWRGTAGGHAGGGPALAPDLRSAGEQAWTAGLTARRAGPFGTLFTATGTFRRTPGHVSLLADATGMSVPGSGAWSALFDPSQKPGVGDVRLRLERLFKLPGAEITAFGEVYRSFSATPGKDLSPGVPGTRAPTRTGSAVRGGASIRF